ITTHNGYYDDQHNRIPAVNINDYPAIKDHLDKFLDKLLKRSSKGKTPYNLQYCISMSEFEKSKIVYPETTMNACFALDNSKYIVEKTCYILTGEYLNYLANTLSSKLFEYAYRHIFSNITLGKNGYQYNKCAMMKLPIKRPNDDSKLLSDDEIFDLYELSENEKEYILSKCK
ncbi:MAG: hypothetical protein LBF68_02405, partial [Christensenellaceae bacterium]|nr:hypothetical protein [Christensenellaceae bacterium]